MATKLLRIDAEVYDRLRKHCAKHDNTMAKVANRAITKELNKRGAK